MYHKLNKPICTRVISSRIELTDEIMEREYSCGDRVAMSKVKELTEYLSSDSPYSFGWRCETSSERIINWYLIVNKITEE